MHTHNGPRAAGPEPMPPFADMPAPLPGRPEKALPVKVCRRIRRNVGGPKAAVRVGSTCRTDRGVYTRLECSYRARTAHRLLVSEEGSLGRNGIGI